MLRSWLVCPSCAVQRLSIWLPLPPTVRTCRCGRPLDVLGTTAHAQTWACWGDEASHWKAQQPESAVRLVDEFTNVLIRDLDIALPEQVDERHIEVIVDGLPLFHGAQLAIDTTLVSPLTGTEWHTPDVQ